MPRFSIRAKFLLLSLLMATLPWFGLQFVRETEAFLRDNLQRSVLTGATALALAVSDRGLLAGAAGEPRETPLLYAHPVENAPQIDGYDSDWLALEPFAEALLPETADAPPSRARYLLASNAEHIYLLVRVIDDDVRYADLRAATPGDRVELRLSGKRHGERRYSLASSAPGWVSAYQRLDDGRERYEPRIRAEWQSWGEGYRLEIRLPRDMLADGGLAVLVEDRDLVASGIVVNRLASAWRNGAPAPRSLVLPSPELARVLKASGLVPGRRARVLDGNGYVLARAGNLAAIAPPEAVNPLIAWLLPPPDATRLASLPDEPRVRGELLQAALGGETVSRWLQTGQEGVNVVAVAEPVRDAGGVAGVLLVEESTSAVLSARRRALASLLDVTLFTALLGTVALLVFAGRVSARLRRLRDDAEQAIDAEGRIRAPFTAPAARDEIGDLGRAFAAMLQRLQGYNDYLENLARRLSHELRTPLAVVRTSLEALEADPEAGDDYRERARRGVERLDRLLTRMGEATRIERAIQSGERESVRLDELLRGVVAGYRATFAPRSFELELPETPVIVSGASDLLVQMTDKLVANALDFGLPGQPVRITLRHAAGGRAVLEVIDKGPCLPAGETRLFDSMVSVRAARGAGDEQPHLGLGLHIVRLVARYHGGDASAHDLADGSGVCVRVEMREATESARA